MEIGYADITNWRSTEDVVKGWMDSSGHWENILTRGYDSEGIGVAFGGGSTVLGTQNFC